MGNDLASFAQRSVADVAEAFPQSIAVFEDAGIDFSCRGLRSIADAAAAAGYEVEDLRAVIEALPPPAGARRWSERSVEELTRFLVSDHHEFATASVPALRALIAKAIDRNPNEPRFKRLAAMFSKLSAAILVHAEHEEHDLFSTFGVTRDAAKTRLSQRVLREFVEHESFNEQLRMMQELCLRIDGDSARELLAELDRVARTIRYHMHLENNVLYPRAIEIENELQRAS